MNKTNLANIVIGFLVVAVCAWNALEIRSLCSALGTLETEVQENRKRSIAQSPISDSLQQVVHKDTSELGRGNLEERLFRRPEFHALRNDVRKIPHTHTRQLEYLERLDRNIENLKMHSFSHSRIFGIAIAKVDGKPAPIKEGSVAVTLWCKGEEANRYTVIMRLNHLGHFSEYVPPGDYREITIQNQIGLIDGKKWKDIQTNRDQVEAQNVTIKPGETYILPDLVFNYTSQK